MKNSFKVHEGNTSYEITSNQLAEYASLYRLERLIPGRYSWLFVLNLIVLDVDPFSIIDEIKALEGVGQPLHTKPASEFKGNHLRGLWHKHWSSSFFPVKEPVAQTP
ncbi:hypothetical protein [Nitrospira sp. Kam-Ns4a]